MQPQSGIARPQYSLYTCKVQYSPEGVTVSIARNMHKPLSAQGMPCHDVEAWPGGG